MTDIEDLVVGYGGNGLSQATRVAAQKTVEFARNEDNRRMFLGFRVSEALSALRADAIYRSVGTTHRLRERCDFATLVYAAASFYSASSGFGTTQGIVLGWIVGCCYCVFIFCVRMQPLLPNAIIKAGLNAKRTSQFRPIDFRVADKEDVQDLSLSEGGVVRV